METLWDSVHLFCKCSRTFQNLWQKLILFSYTNSLFYRKKQFSISILFFSTPSLQKDAFSTIKLVTNYDLKPYFVNHQLQLNETCVDACQTDFRLNFLLLMKRTSFQSNKTEHFPCIFWFYLVQQQTWATISLSARQKRGKVE